MQIFFLAAKWDPIFSEYETSTPDNTRTESIQKKHETRLILKRFGFAISPYVYQT